MEDNMVQRIIVFEVYCMRAVHTRTAMGVTVVPVTKIKVNRLFMRIV